MSLLALIPLLGTLIDRIIPDKAKAIELQIELTKTINEMDMQQLEVNKKEAEHASIFVAGWRPFIGWICGIALAVRFLVLPLLSFIFTVLGHPVVLPEIEMTELMGILGGMLGLGAMRTVEKIQGVERTEIITPKDRIKKEPK